MNSNGFFIFILIFKFILSTPCSAQVKPAANITDNNEVADILFICKNSKATRWLRAFRVESGKCHTVYSKEGYLQVISSATYMTSCEGVLHNVRKNIEEGGFRCSKLDSYSYLEIE